ncbi:NnrU family protein [Sphingomonas sp. DT-204]|uniref:NnrU family protein n=1 Tax=Sphingomonas sp. DT-204 TaxID=3396166 RepID=UPI003F1B64D6
MTPLGWVVVAAIAFVGSHFLLSHPLRAPVTRAVGERGFFALYLLTAWVTLIWLGWAYWAMPAETPLWPVGDGLWVVGTLLTYVASVLLIGSFARNPAFPTRPGAPPPTDVPEPRGVFSVTRHPMMWAFALWGVTHMLVMPIASNLVLAGAITVLALIGAALQDRKKEALQGERWRAWEAKTSYWPFAAIAAGRTRFTPAGVGPVLGGFALWLAATWAHVPLTGWPAGVWKWIG